MLDINETTKRRFIDHGVMSWRIYVYNSSGTLKDTLTNKYLVSESITINEKMCSRDELKFGLCEGSSIEFQYFGRASILGCRIKVEADALSSEGATSSETVNLGYFDVETCARQASTGIMKVTAYNSLKNKYLDADVTETVQELAVSGETAIGGAAGSISVNSILISLLSQYSIDKDITTSALTKSITGISQGSVINLKLAEDGKATGQYLHICTTMYTVGPEFDLTKFYIFKFYAAKILAYIKSINGAENSEIIETDSSTSESTLYSNFDAYRAGGSYAKDVKGYASIFIGDTELKLIQYNFEGKDITTESTTNVHPIGGLGIVLPVIFLIDTNETASFTTTEVTNAAQAFWNTNFMDIYLQAIPDAALRRITSTEAAGFSDVTLRKIQSAVYELGCQYGKLDRSTDKFYGVELNTGGLYPTSSLYPKDTLYPSGGVAGTFKNEYISLFTDPAAQKKFKYLIITYKTTDDDGNETQSVLQRTVNTNGNVNYNMSDNWLLLNLVWTSDEVGEFADAMVKKMKSISWRAFDLDTVGMPWLECGDMLEINTDDGVVNSYILERSLSGLRHIEDNFTNGTVETF